MTILNYFQFDDFKLFSIWRILFQFFYSIWRILKLFSIWRIFAQKIQNSNFMKNFVIFLFFVHFRFCGDVHRSLSDNAGELIAWKCETRSWRHGRKFKWRRIGCWRSHHGNFSENGVKIVNEKFQHDSGKVETVRGKSHFGARGGRKHICIHGQRCRCRPTWSDSGFFCTSSLLKVMLILYTRWRSHNFSISFHFDDFFKEISKFQFYK